MDMEVAYFLYNTINKINKMDLNHLKNFIMFCSCMIMVSNAIFSIISVIDQNSYRQNVKELTVKVDSLVKQYEKYD